MLHYAARPSSWTVQLWCSNGGRLFAPWPDPTAVARSLTNRWNTLNPNPDQHLDQDPRNWRHLWVSDIEAHTELINDPNLTIPAILGRIQYRCDDPATAHDFHRLLSLAEYAGIGRYTARGLGNRVQ
ncbi:CRISPR system precrRNA processing endoribonuclease RAMP protein Cas6 [Nocardia sp. NPDC003979]